MNEELSEENLSKLGLEVSDLKASPLHYIDPAWDYANIFKLLVYFQGRVEATIGMISDVETVTTETDQKLSLRLDELILYLQSIKKRLK